MQVAERECRFALGWKCSRAITAKRLINEFVSYPEFTRLTGSQAKSDLLIVQHRRARAAMGGVSMRQHLTASEAISGAKAELAGDSLPDWLLAVGKGRRDLNGAAADQVAKGN